MTVEQACCVCFGVFIEAMTFALGIMVGASLRRKDFNAWEESETESRRLRPRSTK
jgi:hypothetical protein